MALAKLITASEVSHGKHMRKEGRLICFLSLSYRLCHSRLITELHPHEDSFFNCVACTHDTSGTPLLFAGTNDGGIRQLALDDINADECDEQLI